MQKFSLNITTDKSTLVRLRFLLGVTYMLRLIHTLESTLLWKIRKDPNPVEMKWQIADSEAD